MFLDIGSSVDKAERREPLKLVGMRTLLLGAFVTLNMSINSVIVHISK